MSDHDHDSPTTDWSYVQTLLNVIHQAAAAGPKFAAITAEAADELLTYMAGPQPAPAQPEETDDVA